MIPSAPLKKRASQRNIRTPAKHVAATSSRPTLANAKACLDTKPASMFQAKTALEEFLSQESIADLGMAWAPRQSSTTDAAKGRDTLCLSMALAPQDKRPQLSHHSQPQLSHHSQPPFHLSQPHQPTLNLPNNAAHRLYYRWFVAQDFPLNLSPFALSLTEFPETFRIGAQLVKRELSHTRMEDAGEDGDLSPKSIQQSFIKIS